MSMSQAPLAMIAAISRDGVIGIGDAIPWHYPKDFRFFRRMTVGHVLIMGHSTFRSLGKPLPGRQHFVLSRQTKLQLTGCEVFPHLDLALAAARRIDPCPMIAGGAQVYAAAMPAATLMYLTHIDEDVLADNDQDTTMFPKVTWHEWKEIEESRQGALRFVTYQRIAPAQTGVALSAIAGGSTNG